MTKPLRRAGSSDLDIVNEITADAFRPYETSIAFVPVPMVEDHGPRIARGEVWLLEVAEDAVGLIVLEEKSDHLFIFSVAVRPDSQGMGYGLALLRFAEERADAIGAGEIRLFTNRRMERNIAIYERLGYSTTGIRPHPTHPGHFIVEMAKVLP